jgi:hypothetical protein
MALKRVIAYFMHESERDDVIPHLSDRVVTDSFVVGEIDDAEITTLENRGIIFREIEETSSISPDPLEVEERVMGVRGETDPVLPLRPSVPSNMYFLTLSGPLVSEWRGMLENPGVQIRAALPGYRWVSRIPSTQLAAVRSLPFVRNLEMRESNHNLPTRVVICSHIK